MTTHTMTHEKWKELREREWNSGFVCGWLSTLVVGALTAWVLSS